MSDQKPGPDDVLASWDALPSGYRDDNRSELIEALRESLRQRDEAREALGRAYDEGVHSTRCNVRKGECSCWVADAIAALNKTDSGEAG